MGRWRKFDAGGPFVFIGWLVAVAAAQNIDHYEGRKLTMTAAPLDETGLTPMGPASLCLEGPPARQCYTAPEDFGRDPSATLVHLDPHTQAVLFRADSSGVSGWGVHLALLQPVDGADLNDLFSIANITLSNQSQHQFWNEVSISQWPIFVTADYVWGPSEAHYDRHRYLVSAYVRRSSSLIDGLHYYLADRYMTVRKYDLEEKPSILDGERPEIMSRLRRVAALIKQEKAH